eukprot:Rhum_TRINITY_DN13089_c0_g3::Rhum_TRINITY_DN13089_c0_g3_i1::g.56784::m.56784/K03671/trxA; thioredoxin 1
MFDAQTLVRLGVLYVISTQFGTSYALLALVGLSFLQYLSGSGEMVKDWKNVHHPEAGTFSVENMRDMIETKSKGKLVVVDFYATWCPPCRTLAPKFADLSETYPNVTFIGINADEFPDLRSKYGVECYPTVKFFKDNTLVHTVKGANYDEIANTIISQQ